MKTDNRPIKVLKKVWNTMNEYILIFKHENAHNTCAYNDETVRFIDTKFHKVVFIIVHNQLLISSLSN